MTGAHSWAQARPGVFIEHQLAGTLGEGGTIPPSGIDFSFLSLLSRAGPWGTKPLPCVLASSPGWPPVALSPGNTTTLGWDGRRAGEGGSGVHQEPI